MIVKAGHKLFGKVVLKSANNLVIPGVFYFNTKTGHTKMYLFGEDRLQPDVKRIVTSGNPFGKKGAKIVTLSTTIKGAKLYHRETGEEIK